MQNQKAQSGSFVIALVAIVAVLGIVGYQLLGLYNSAVKFEVDIDAKYVDNQNVLSNDFYGKLDAANLGNQKYKDLMKSMLDGVAQGYQGASGGKAMALWLSNNVPQLDASVAKAFIEIGEKGLTKFSTSQTALISLGQEYTKYYSVQPRGFILGLMGKPSAGIAEKLKPVTDAKSDESFKTKQRVSVSEPEQPAGK